MSTALTLSTNVYVTGIGAISSIGKSIHEMDNSLLHLKTGLSPISVLETRFKGELIAGEIKLTNEQLADYAKLINTTIYSRTALLSIIAVKESMNSAGLQKLNPKTTAFVSATTVGGMDYTEGQYGDFLNGSSLVNFIDAHNSGYHVEQVADLIGIKEHIFTINTACSSSANAISLGVRLIRSGKFDCVIVGGTDAMSKYTLNGFNALMLLDKESCKPFDKNRKGINLGEAAAYLVLESENAISQLGKKPIGKITGFGMTNDAYHQTSSSAEGKGIMYAMTQALNSAKILPADINYVNAHGTGTANNDLTEGNAMKTIFQKTPLFSSTKSYTGHTLAASGALEAIISLLSIKNQGVFPNLNFNVPITEHGLVPVTTYQSAAIKHVMSNSIGIGGFCSSLIISNN